MKRQLFKHEVLRTRAMLGWIWGVCVMFALVGGLLALTSLPMVSVFGRLLCVLGAFAPLPATQLALAIDYWLTNYQRTGYFVHTLPVRGATQYWVKLAWGMVSSIVALALTVVLGAWFAVGVAVTEGQGVQALLDAVRAGWTAVASVMPAWGWVALPVLGVCILTSYLAQFYFCASVGSERGLNHLGVAGPLVVWVGLYFAVQILSFAFLLGVPFGLGMTDGRLALVGVNWLDAMVHKTNPQAMPFGVLPMILVVLAAVIWRTRLSWEKKVSLV